MEVRPGRVAEFDNSCSAEVSANMRQKHSAKTFCRKRSIRPKPSISVRLAFFLSNPRPKPSISVRLAFFCLILVRNLRFRLD